MNEWIIRNITLPLWEWGAKRQRLSLLKELEQSQYLTIKKLRQLQSERLQLLMHHAYKNVPYYQELFDRLKIKPDDLKTVQDLEKLPILTKDQVMQNFEKLKAKDVEQYKPTLYATGGTSGRHFHFLNAQKTFDAHMAAAYRAWRWSGWDLGKRLAYIWGASMDLKNENSLKSKIRRFFTENKLVIQGMVFTEESLKRDLERMKKFKPEFIISYPSTLVIIVRYMKAHDIHIPIKAIITSSEKLFPWQRELIEGHFGCKIHDDYGGRESSIRSTQCEHGNYHTSIENGVLETVNDKGKQVIGKPGKVLLTEFHNFAMPLIRYENTDVATLTEDSCPCGRHLPLIKDIQGRVSDIFTTPDGKTYPAQMLMVAFLDFEGEFYQMVQEKVDQLQINIVKGDSFKQETLDKSLEELKKWLGDKVQVHVSFLDEIPTTKNGKRRYFISKVEAKF